MVVRCVAALCVVVLFGAAARAETFTVSGPERVEDAALLDGEFAGWNFGGGPLLEAGFMGGIYVEHRATSVVRFDLRSAPVGEVKSAKLRLYKPKDFVQVAPVEVRVYEASGDWTEGTGVCEPQQGGVTHMTRIDRAGHQPVGVATAPDDRGAWIEIELPAALVQRWLTGANGGLLIDAAGEAKEWGHHVFFNASDHWDGKGPELVVEGRRGSAESSATTSQPLPNVYALPPAESLEPWLAKNSRLARFTKDGDMNAAQQRLFQFYDTTVRERLIKERYQVPLVQVLRAMDALVRKGGHNDAALRDHLKRVRELLLVWEYIRETSWYTSGPLADTLTPRQLGILFGRSIFGRMEAAANEKKNRIWQHVPPDKIDAHVERALRSTRERLKMTPEQFAVMEAGIADAERRENEYLGKFRRDFDACRRMLDTNDPDEAKMFRVVRDLHLNHELFLYYQSIFDTPRWRLLVEHAPPAALAAWIVETRRGHYERQTGMKIAEEDE